MAAISETTGGKISNFGGSFYFMKKQFGEVFKPVIHTVINILQKLIKFLEPVVNG